MTDVVVSLIRAKTGSRLNSADQFASFQPSRDMARRFFRGLVYIIPMNSDVEARPYTPDIRVETYLRRGSGPACENVLR
jgi:hypothetical protein